MRATFRLGRIGGVPVGVNWSVLVIFALIAWGLAAERFPARYPSQPTWAYAAAGVGAAVVFFAGLLAHEVSHAVLARRNGIPVESITLWLFGGLARLQGEARDPGAGVGPLVSFVLALVFGGIAAAIGLLAGLGLAFGTFAWLSGINVALAVFNIIPAAPLDGGRLLRAALWKIRGDRTWAAVIAARAGRVLGAALIGLGIWEIFATRAGFGGIWIAVIGWFLISAAAAEERQARLGSALSGVRVRDVMSPQPYGAPADASVADFLDGYLFRHRFSSFPVLAMETSKVPSCEGAWDVQQPSFSLAGQALSFISSATRRRRTKGRG
jgi:Zn-dependent protease